MQIKLISTKISVIYNYDTARIQSAWLTKGLGFESRHLQNSFQAKTRPANIEKVRDSKNGLKGLPYYEN